MKPKLRSNSRRKFLTTSTLGALALASGTAHQVWARQSKTSLGVALVGLGSYATHQLAPSLLKTKNCHLAGIVTGTPSKADKWQEQYQIKPANTYNYETFDRIADNEDIDIVYVVLPNSMHAEFTIRAAEAGKHVICEKPMAISADECRQMISACKQAGRKLGIGYRCHYDPYNLEMMRLGQQQVYGPITHLESSFGFRMGNLNQWRAKKAFAGGGPLMDVGIYALQGSIYTQGALPLNVRANDRTKDKASWPEVEGSLSWEMEFPSGVKAQYYTSYEENIHFLKAKTDRGEFGLSPAYSYDGLQGYTPDGAISYPPMKQQAAQMDAFARAVMHNEPLLVPGEMGLRDVLIMEKIYQSAAEGGAKMSLEDLPSIIHKV